MNYRKIKLKYHLFRVLVMDYLESNFLRALNKKPIERVPLYCTGYPEKEFMKNYIKQYELKSDNNENLMLMDKDYSLIKNLVNNPNPLSKTQDI